MGYLLSFEARNGFRLEEWCRSAFEYLRSAKARKRWATSVCVRAALVHTEKPAGPHLVSNGAAGGAALASFGT